MYYISIHLGDGGDSYYILKDDFVVWEIPIWKSDNASRNNWFLNKGQRALLDNRYSSGIWLVIFHIFLNINDFH